MAFNSYISLIKGKLGGRSPEVAVDQPHTPGGGEHSSITRPAADGLGLDVMSGANSGPQDGSGTETANLGDTARHGGGITTEVEPVELREEASGYHLGDTATHERGTSPAPDPAFQVSGDFAERHANVETSSLGGHVQGTGGGTHSIFTEITLPAEQLTSDHGGMETTDESPPLGDNVRVLDSPGSGSDEQVVGVTEYGTTDLGHAGGVFSFKSASGMDSETERLSFSSDRGGGPSGGVQKFDGPQVGSGEGGHVDSGQLRINDQTPADWNERSSGSHELKTEWITSATGGTEPAHGDAAQDVFVTEVVSRPDAESNVSVFGMGGGVDDERAADLRVSHDTGEAHGFTVKFDGGHDVKWEGPDYDATKNFAGEQPPHEGLMMPFVEQNQVVEPQPDGLDAHGQIIEEIPVPSDHGQNGLKWEPNPMDESANRMGEPQHEGLILPFVEQSGVTAPRAEGILPYIEAQNVVEGDEPTLERQAPEFNGVSGGSEHDPVDGGSAAMYAVHPTTTASALDAGFTLSDDLVRSVSSLDSDADAPTTLLGDLHHGDQLYTGVNEGSLLGVHDASGHLDPGHHDLGDAHHGHDAGLDHLHHIDLDL